MFTIDEGSSKPAITQLDQYRVSGHQDQCSCSQGRWIDERCLREPNAKALTAELFTDWQWADSAGEFIGSQKRFADLLLTRGIEKWRNTTGLRGFRGLGLKHPPTPAYTPYADN